MFLENNKKGGWIELIVGSMFSGKTEELIRRLRRAQLANKKVEIFKPLIDTRYAQAEVVSHNQSSIRSTPVDSVSSIILLASGMDVVGIDEAQFFDMQLIDVCNQLANQGIRVIVAGLDMDFKGQGFGPIPELMAQAEYLTKVHAICMRCGSLAYKSHRLNNQQELLLLGEKDAYEPLCRHCFTSVTSNTKSE